MAKEIDLRGAFRWGIEFDWAVAYLSYAGVSTCDRCCRGNIRWRMPSRRFARGRRQEQEHEGTSRLQLKIGARTVRARPIVRRRKHAFHSRRSFSLPSRRWR